MPTKLNDINIEEWYEQTKLWKFLTKRDPFKLKNPETQDSSNYFVAKFQKERLTEFVNHEHPERFFSPGERGKINRGQGLDNFSIAYKIVISVLRLIEVKVKVWAFDYVSRIISPLFVSLLAYQGLLNQSEIPALEVTIRWFLE